MVRVLMKVNMPVIEGNKLAKSGKLEETIRAILAEQKPEAAYFVTDKGMRTALLFINVCDSSEVPKYAEPWFLATNASIELTLAMSPEDLAKAAPDITAAAKKFG